MSEGIGKSMEELKKEITCGICQEYYTEPKILPCHHYYCKQCVLTLASRTRVGQPFSCPECRGEACLPEGDVDKLKTSFNINRLKAIVLAMEQTYSKVKPKDKSCPEHKELPIIYCFTCDSLICQRCTLKDHQNHDFEFCKLSAQTTKEMLLGKLEPLRKHKSSISHAILCIQKCKKEIETQGEEVAINIQNSFKELRQILDKREQELLQEAAETVHMKIGKLSVQEENLVVASAEIQSAVDYTEQCVRHCTDNEVMSMHTELKRQIEQKMEERSNAGRSLEPEEEADIGVEVRCAEAMQQLCQTLANIIQLSSWCLLRDDNTNHEVNKQSNVLLATKFSSNKIFSKQVDVTSSLRCMHSNTVSSCKVDPTGASQYSIQYTPTVRGRHELTVSVEGQQVEGSPFPMFASVHPTQLRKPVKVWRGFTKPTGIAVNSIGEILVCEAKGSVVKLHRDGNRTTLVNQNMVTALREIEVDHANNIYCISDKSDKVFKCDQNGRNNEVKIITRVKGQCWGLAVVGEEVMICGRGNGGIVSVYDKELNYRRCIGQKHKGNIYAVAGDHHDNVYCADYDNACIHVFTNDGVFQRSFGCDEDGEKKVEKPWSLCVSGYYVYVCNGGSHNISVFTTDGVYVTTFCLHSDFEGDFYKPFSICVDQDGFVYVIDNLSHTVQCF